MFKLNIQGLDELQNKLRRLKENVSNIGGTRQVPIKDLLIDEFMRANTKYQTCQEMLDKSPFKIEAQADFDAIPHDQWNGYIRANTKFSDWNEMLEEAAKEMIQRELSKDLQA